MQLVSAKSFSKCCHYFALLVKRVCFLSYIVVTNIKVICFFVLFLLTQYEDKLFYDVLLEN